MKHRLEQYYKYLKEQKLLGGISGLLEWDQEAVMPEGNSDFRSDQIAYISGLMHKAQTSKEYINLVNELYENKELLDAVDARSVEVSKRDLDKVIKLPADFVEETAKATSLAHQAWLDSKIKEDFGIFKPHLQKQIELKKRYADYIDSSKPIYNVLLDDFEEDLTTEDIDKIFIPLKNSLKDLISQVKSKDATNEFFKIKFNKYKAKELIRFMTSKIGFDYSKGAEAEVHHPFETSLSSTDIRINMSYYHKDIKSSITGAIHELGHGLYEQNIDSKYHKTDLDSGVSLGIHESQSRLLENMIGRSKPFWEFFGPKISEYMELSDSLIVDNLVNDLNIAKPSFIRIEADELTYNMHIILRYEIERQMLESNFNLDELPELWNSKMKDLLGITPRNLSEGCLQDTHWSIGAMGYFATYTLGNIIAGQLWHKFISENPTWESAISVGDFSTYFTWFKNNIWQHGSFYKPKELLSRVVGEEINSEYLIKYLVKKYVE